MHNTYLLLVLLQSCVGVQRFPLDRPPDPRIDPNPLIDSDLPLDVSIRKSVDSHPDLKQWIKKIHAYIVTYC